MTEQYWQQQGQALVWDVRPGQRHGDDYEMSGPYCDCIPVYGVGTQGELTLSLDCYFPTLRTIPNDTHATFSLRLEQERLPWLLCDARAQPEYPRQFRLDGIWSCESDTPCGVRVLRQILPSHTARCCIQRICLTAERTVTVSFSVPPMQVLGYTTGARGVYVTRAGHDGGGPIRLEAGQSRTFTAWVTAEPANIAATEPDGPAALRARRERISALCDHSVVVDTGLPELDAMARFARLRAGESIFETLTGKNHCPGGRTYYAATWCNDQVEYAGPYFATTGDPVAIEAALQAYRVYVPFMADNFAPIPSSVIAEGLDIWNGAGDRGDAAMYLYGASAFALYLGDRAVARELYGPICWCAEYCHRRTTPEGVIRSESDELEGRIPTDGYANLATSSLCYGGLVQAAKLALSLGDEQTAQTFRCRAWQLGQAMEVYFGAQLHGMQTYRYSAGFDTLRAWICLPLCMGILERAEDTVQAMFSPWLWTGSGLLSCELSPENRNSTTWDRSTLYGLKAAFLAGRGDLAMPKLLAYCRERLLGDRVPYAVEASPEGNRRQLSAESALFMRLITEGMLALQPESLTSFSFVPCLPPGLPHMHISHLHLAGKSWKIEVNADSWSVRCGEKTVASGRPDGKRVRIAVG